MICRCKLTANNQLQLQSLHTDLPQTKDELAFLGPFAIRPTRNTQILAALSDIPPMDVPMPALAKVR